MPILSRLCSRDGKVSENKTTQGPHSISVHSATGGPAPQAWLCSRRVQGGTEEAALAILQPPWEHWSNLFRRRLGQGLYHSEGDVDKHHQSEVQP